MSTNSFPLTDLGAHDPGLNPAPEWVDFGANAIRSAISTGILLAALVVVFLLATA